MEDGISIVVPTLNEADNIAALIDRIHKTLSLIDIVYEIVFIDDHSSDNTIGVVSQLSQEYPISIYAKKGLRGKAYSIVEGVEKSRFEYIVMIDADLQYPPEAIPEMFALLIEQNLGVVIAKRDNHNEPFLRKSISIVFQSLFGRFLHGFPYDVQSGLKIFRKEILTFMDQSAITPWTFDLSLLSTTRELGYSIDEIKIPFFERKKGKSKINIFKSSYEIGLNALKVKLFHQTIFPVIPLFSDSMRGAGVVYKRERLITHTTLSSGESALESMTTWQKVLIVLLIMGILVGLLLNWLLTLKVFIALLSLIYFTDILFNLYLITKSLHNPPELDVTDNDLYDSDDNLPVYTILCPLYKESKILPQFIRSIEQMDWPKNKLDVLLLLEEDDNDTLTQAYNMHLPEYIKPIVVPFSKPKTKPKACNFGLSFARGEYLVIYDAEDRPEPDQLKKVYAGFQHVPHDTVCLQAKLNYYNSSQNILTKLFTAEYSLWFDVVLTGLQVVNTIIPLGGTSNHFKTRILQELNGWDPFNVTEDCDLGVRLFKHGYKTAVINSTTYEEANSKPINWLRQRSRWLKGYFQTYLVHMRHPISFIKEYGYHTIIFQLIIGARISFILINPFLWAMTFAYFAFNHTFGSTIESLYPAPVFYVAILSTVFGNFIYIYNYMIGCAKREQWNLILYIYLIPLYWLLAFFAALLAFYQLLFKPHYWEKTVHGFHLPDVTEPEPTEFEPIFVPAFSEVRKIRH